MGTACSAEKSAQIKATINATKARRSDKDIATFECKINHFNISKSTRHHLKMLFVEAKWLYNWYLSDTERMANRTPSNIHSLDKDGNQIARSLMFLSSQMKQAVHAKLIQNMSSLKATKSKGRRIGRLKFISEYNSIELVQPGVTFRIKGQKLFLQGCKHGFQLRGLNQLPSNPDICNAQLIKKPSGYYIKITIARLKTKGFGTIGVDFGIKNQLTLSNGIVIKFGIVNSKRIKKLQRKLARQKKDSNSRLKTKQKLLGAHEKANNKKRECRNKIVGYLKTFDRVVYQNDSIKGWQAGNYGKAIQSSPVGAIKSRIKSLESAIEVERFTPTSKPCNKCGTIHNLTLSARIFKCDECGEIIDRDLNAAIVIEALGVGSRNIPVERGKLTPDETLTSACKIMNSSYLHVSLVNDLGSHPL